MTILDRRNDANATQPMTPIDDAYTVPVRPSGPLSRPSSHRVRLTADGRPKTITRPHPHDIALPDQLLHAGQPPTERERAQFTFHAAIVEATHRLAPPLLDKLVSKHYDQFGGKFQVQTTIRDHLGQIRAHIVITGRHGKGMYVTWGNHFIIGFDLVTMRQRVLARWPEAETTPWEFIEFPQWDEDAWVRELQQIQADVLQRDARRRTGELG